MKPETGIQVVVVLLGILAMVVSFPASSLGDVPHQINFQGYITDDAGTPLNEAITMRFDCYDTHELGNLLWGEEQSVEVIGGIYNVQLGAVTPLEPEVFAETSMYLEVAISIDNGLSWEILTPRQQITSAAYALKAENTDMLEGKTIAQILGSTNGNGFEVEDAERYGMYIGHAGYDGVYVSSAESDGISINSAGYNGVSVWDAGRNGIDIGTTIQKGIWIWRAGTTGVRVHSAGSPSTDENFSYSNNGFEVNNAEGNGLFVGHSDVNGVQVNSAGVDGVRVGSAIYTGVRVESAGSTGIYVDSAGFNGVQVGSVGNPNNTRSSPYKDGFVVNGAEGHGVFVGHSDVNGVHVESADGYAGYFGGNTRVTENLQVDGSVGIGTDNPEYSLDVRGGRIQLKYDHPSYGERWIAMRGDGGALDLQFEGANLAIQSTIDGEHVCLNPGRNSNVGIGTWSPSQRLDVNGNARFRSVASGVYNRPLNLTTDGTLTTATSDGRLKTNVEPIEDGLGIVEKLQGVRFNWKSDPEGDRRIGLIAQDVEPILPELTFTNPADGYLGVNYAELSAVLIEAVKTQQQTIGKLQHRIISLEETKLSEFKNLKDQLASLQDTIQKLIAYQEHASDPKLLSAANMDR